MLAGSVRQKYEDIESRPGGQGSPWQAARESWPGHVAMSRGDTGSL